MTLSTATLSATSQAAQAGAKADTKAEAKDVVWHLVASGEVEGEGWLDTGVSFDRLPSKAEATVPAPVWGLSHDSAGICYRFMTDAPTLTVRWSLTKASLAMPHMPATGVSGVDLYVRREGGDWRFVGNGRPTVQDDNQATFNLAGSGPREYRLYFPLYNGVTKLQIGTPNGFPIGTAPAYDAGHAKPVVFYGTSITQGGCASRPGMAFTALVGRRLERPVINLGFSGNGKMEIALADLLCDLDPQVIVLDCLHNMNESQTRERIEPFIRRLRQKFPTTPILLAEDAYPYNPVESPKGKITREIVERLQKEGIPGLHYLPMRYALGNDGEGTVDGTHPTDLGMARMADAFVAGLTPLLPR